MPSSSGKQHRLMALVANNPAASKRLGIPQSVGKDFMEADKGRKFAKGGEMKESKSMIKHEQAEMMGMKKGGGVKKYASGGDVTGMGASKERKGMTMEKMGKVNAGGIKKFGEHNVQTKGHTRGTQVKMAKGGKAYGGKC